VHTVCLHSIQSCVCLALMSRLFSQHRANNIKQDQVSAGDNSELDRKVCSFALLTWLNRTYRVTLDDVDLNLEGNFPQRTSIPHSKQIKKNLIKSKRSVIESIFDDEQNCSKAKEASCKHIMSFKVERWVLVHFNCRVWRTEIRGFV
jgi:hypothetical protein